MKLRHVFFCASCALLLTACGGDERGPSGGLAASGAAGDPAALPVPGGAQGSITGMPDAPPPGAVGAPIQAPMVTPLPDEATSPETVDPDNDTVTADEPGSDAAVQVIRDYYAAINRHDHAAAYALWRDRGQRSGKSATEFAESYADTSGVSVRIGEPGRIDAGAGQRHIDVPVKLIARGNDGSERRYSGTYRLQRSVVDGADDDQQAWRIDAANLVQGP